MASGINIYSFFQISEIVIPDIWKKLFCLFSYIRNCYFWYPKLLFRISEIVISDIENNNSGYQKLCQKGVLFEISKKVILDIKNNNFGYPKINIYFGYQKLLFWISEITISDIRNNNFGYLKINIYFRYPK